MPELPEVETIVRDIRPALRGARSTAPPSSHDDVLRGVTRRTLLRHLSGASIVDVFRRAKHAVLDLGSRRLVVQPGMTGSLVVHRRPLAADERKYAVLRAELDDGAELVYRDVRRLGTLLLLDERAWAAYDQAIGPEPLAPSFTARAIGRGAARLTPGGQEGRDGPAASRGRRQHLRERGALRRRHRSVETGARR